MKKHKQDKSDNQENKIIELAKELEELKIGWQRTQADFDNFRKRTEEENVQKLTYLKADFALKITPVLDNFGRAFEHAKKDDPTVQGFLQIKKQLEDILSSEGLEKIEAQKGTRFNPEYHEAISCEENNLAEDTIIDEVESGWLFQNRTIKPSKVRVSKGK